MLAASAALLGSFTAARAEGADPPAPPAAAPPAAAPATATAAAPPAAASAAAPWFAPVFDRAVASVVRVESASGVGAGFVFASSRHLATSFHLVAVGREVNVVFRDGRSVSADVVATDPENDLAILSLAEPASAAPLLASTAQVGLGTPVLVIGHALAHRGSSGDRRSLLGGWTPSHGMVLSPSAERLQIDAPIYPGSVGGPVLDREGRVLGVASRSPGEGLHVAASIAKLQELACHIGQEGVYQGRWTRDGTLSALLQASREGLLFGVGAGARFIYRDRWALDARIGLLWTVGSPDLPSPLITRARWRSYLEASFGRRWLPLVQPWPLYLGVAAGGALAVDRVSETRATFTTNPVGEPSLLVQRDSVFRPIAWPMLSLSAESGAASVSYAVLLDVREPAASFQRVSISFMY
jgi:Trypsin-like peptidase domain